MRDNYAADVGDFGKLILLRRLSHTSSQYRLGVNWYRTTRTEDASSDGGHVAYLHSQPDYCKCDPPLYEALQKIASKPRSVQALEQSGIFPPGSLFYSCSVPFGSTDLAQRVEDREQWFEGSIRQLQKADVIFIDPDNGVQTQRITKAQTRAIKYAFHDEIRRYCDASKIVIVYNHQDRNPSDRRINKFIALQNELDNRIQLRVLRFKRVSVRYYLVLYRPVSISQVNQLFASLVAAPYDFLFEEVRLH